MVATCSPHHPAGGTVHLSSPTHIHHVDNTAVAAAALRSLRRSTSRSPSRRPTFHLVPSPSSPRSPRAPRSALASPPPATPASSTGSDLADASVATVLSSNLAVPFPPSAKIQRTSAKKASSMRLSMKARGSPGSPARRPLMPSRDHGNAASLPPSPAAALSKARPEQRFARSASPTEKSPADREARRASMIVEDQLLGSHHLDPRVERLAQTASAASSTSSSPLKRSDGVMNLDQASLGSPVAKRRSLHTPTADLVHFEAAFDPASGHGHDARHADASMTDGGAALATATAATFASTAGASGHHSSSLTKRSSSLRKSTLQQRHDKPTFARARLNPDLALEFANPAVLAAAGGGHRAKAQRMSLENFLPPPSRDSPFATPAALPNASLHALCRPSGDGPPPPRHPLSHAVTQSSSGSSLADESPIHAPMRQGEWSRPVPGFGRSLPLDAVRPAAAVGEVRDASTQASASDSSSFITPHSYKLVKPLPAAFMSTGLISKRNRYPEEANLAVKAQMPDTPCKRPTSMFQPAAAAAPVPVPGSAFGKSREMRHEFGTPSTPFNPHQTRAVPGTFGKGVSIFGSRFGSRGLVRQGSFVSLDGDEAGASPSAKADSQSSEYELPPTPTKCHLGAGQETGHVHALVQASDLTPPLNLITSVPSNSQGAGLLQAENASPDRAQGVGGRRSSPQTPQETVLPPDPSGLSISGHGDAAFVRPGHQRSDSASTFPPATPTAVRDHLPHLQKHRPMVAPINSFADFEVDSSLTARFDKVELIGTGEFSQVYRVTQSSGRRRRSVESTPTPTPTPTPSPLARPSPRSVPSPLAFAVKKSRHAYAGAKDRQRKLQEAEILRALRESDHVVQFVDSWEDRNHLYIQTEFCEEGSLDMFLAQVGRRARLDDFRIWKVMLELAQGIKHIHDAGFIHLDLKPANVLITFEGVLKIGDFGMAYPWPAPPGIEGEGDREYIGPEILMGNFDKPADIFALGLIMLEIAGNVELPDNGPSWQKLRTGDLSDVPSLTSNSSSTVSRDSSGNPVSRDNSAETLYGSDSGEDNFAWRGGREPGSKAGASSTGGSHRGELVEAPAFMIDAHHEHALERVVRWMISPDPQDRPVVDQILDTVGVTWAERRRRAGATIFEGNWGPADEVLTDVEMSDG